MYGMDYSSEKIRKTIYIGSLYQKLIHWMQQNQKGYKKRHAERHALICVYILYWRAKEKLVLNIAQMITIFNI